MSYHYVLKPHTAYASQGTLGWFAHPIYVNGDFPEVMKKAIGEKSAAQGLSESRLPSFSEDEKQLIKGLLTLIVLLALYVIDRNVHCLQ